MTSGNEFLTLPETAALLRIDLSTVRRAISKTVNGIPGGWPSETFINVTPKAERALFRVNRQELLKYLQQSE